MMRFLLVTSSPWSPGASPARSHCHFDGSFYAKECFAGWGFVLVWESTAGHARFVGYAGALLFEQLVADIPCVGVASVCVEAVVLQVAVLDGFYKLVRQVVFH